MSDRVGYAWVPEIGENPRRPRVQVNENPDLLQSWNDPIRAGVVPAGEPTRPSNPEQPVRAPRQTGLISVPWGIPWIPVFPRWIAGDE